MEENVNVNVEKVENEKEEKAENMVVVSQVNDISNITRSNTRVFTTITDKKKIFNLETNCNNKINDCVGETIRVKGVYIKLIETPLPEPIVINEETGEVKESEYKKITILVDDEGKSYVTASKMFANDFIKYIQMVGIEDIEENGVDIKIIKKAVKNSSNQALSFELV